MRRRSISKQYPRFFFAVVLGIAIAACTGSIKSTSNVDARGGKSLRLGNSTLPKGDSASNYSASIDSVGALNSGLWSAATFSDHGVRGFNSTDDISSSSMSDMAGTGANLVRVFVNLRLDSKASSYTSDLSALDSVVRYGTKFGFKVIIVFAPLSTRSTPEFWADTKLQSSIGSSWIAAASKYKENATIAGYDLINEPIAPAGQAQWIRLATQLIEEIRRVDPNHVIIFEPSPGAIPESFSTMTVPLPFDNIVYSVHDYEPYQITHQGILHFTSVTYPSPSTSYIGQVDRTTLSNQLTPVRQFVAKFHVPVYVGEFSCVRWAPNASANNYIADSIALFEAEGYSWSYHSWREFAGWDAELGESYFYQFPYVKGAPEGWSSLSATGERSSNSDTIILLKKYFTLNAHREVQN
jgi:aryl-phospho-beta-D-glucosidase BglC (GH1 family)